MRENRLYGSEGGEARTFPTPINLHISLTRTLDAELPELVFHGLLES